MTRNDGRPHPATPTLRGRVLGTELRRAREASGLSITELAACSGHSPDTVRRLEEGITDASAPDPTLWCRWGTFATSVITILCRISERIDIFAPSGINPAFERLAPDRCTAYVLEHTHIDHTDVTVRVIPRSAGYFPGLEQQPPTRFSLPDGPAIVQYAYPHAAHFTEEPEHLLAAYTLFEQLDQIALAADDR
ncbi:Scr1 family TA system antitoxin-like transcriptional regulator [Actinosynnema sp. CA-299493]